MILQTKLVSKLIALDTQAWISSPMFTVCHLHHCFHLSFPGYNQRNHLVYANLDSITIVQMTKICSCFVSTQVTFSVITFTTKEQVYSVRDTSWSRIFLVLLHPCSLSLFWVSLVWNNLHGIIVLRISPPHFLQTRLPMTSLLCVLRKVCYLSLSLHWAPELPPQLHLAFLKTFSFISLRV